MPFAAASVGPSDVTVDLVIVLDNLEDDLDVVLLPVREERRGGRGHRDRRTGGVEHRATGGERPAIENPTGQRHLRGIRKRDAGARSGDDDVVDTRSKRATVGRQREGLLALDPQGREGEATGNRKHVGRDDVVGVDLAIAAAPAVEEPVDTIGAHALGLQAKAVDVDKERIGRAIGARKARYRRADGEVLVESTGIAHGPWHRDRQAGSSRW